MPSVDDLATMRYARMRWNTPLSEAHAALLLQRLNISAGTHMLDLGCGWGELLLRVLLDKQVTFVRHEAATWREPADRVMCIGASHAFGGTVAALKALTELVRPSGRLLFGDGYWQRPPTIEAANILGEEIIPPADLIEHARALGWRVLHLSTADQREWDDFESTWLAGRQEWLLQHPDDPRAAEVRDELDARLREYVGVYRGVLGLAYLVLGR